MKTLNRWRLVSLCLLSMGFATSAHAQGLCMPLGKGPGASTLCQDSGGNLTTVTPMGHGNVQIYQDPPRRGSSSQSIVPYLYSTPSTQEPDRKLERYLDDEAQFRADNEAEEDAIMRESNAQRLIREGRALLRQLDAQKR